MKNFKKSFILLAILAFLSFGNNAKAQNYYELVVTNNTLTNFTFLTYDNASNQLGIGVVAVSGATTTQCINIGSAFPYTVNVSDLSNCNVTLGYGVFPATWTLFSFNPSVPACSSSSGTNYWQGVTLSPTCGFGTGIQIAFIIN